MVGFYDIFVYFKSVYGGLNDGEFVKFSWIVDEIIRNWVVCREILLGILYWWDINVGRYEGVKMWSCDGLKIWRYEEMCMKVEG